MTGHRRPHAAIPRSAAELLEAVRRVGAAKQVDAAVAFGILKAGQDDPRRIDRFDTNLM